jgi:excisionase family DNA binding protein
MNASRGTHQQPTVGSSQSWVVRGGFAMKIWLNVAEAAEYAGVSRDTIYTACERREIHHARIGGRRAIRLKPEWIDAWLERHARCAEYGHAAGA